MQNLLTQSLVWIAVAVELLSRVARQETWGLRLLLRQLLQGQQRMNRRLIWCPQNGQTQSSRVTLEEPWTTGECLATSLLALGDFCHPKRKPSRADASALQPGCRRRPGINRQGRLRTSPGIITSVTSSNVRGFDFCLADKHHHMVICHQGQRYPNTTRALSGGIDVCCAGP